MISHNRHNSQNGIAWRKGLAPLQAEQKNTSHLLPNNPHSLSLSLCTPPCPRRRECAGTHPRAIYRPLAWSRVSGSLGDLQKTWGIVSGQVSLVFANSEIGVTLQVLSLMSVSSSTSVLESGSWFPHL